MFKMSHQCHHCPESFFSSYSLLSHMRIHNSVEDKGRRPNNGYGQVGDGEYQNTNWQYNFTQWPWNSSNSSSESEVSLSSSKVSGSGQIEAKAGSSPQDQDQDQYESSDERNAAVNNTFPSSNKRSSKSSGSEGKVYECPTCQKIFKSYPGLRYHRNSKHDQNGPYKCTFCDKRFCQKSHLSRHLTLHTGEKNYRCSYCDKTFRIKGNLQIHTRIHTGIKPYSCRTCNKRFTQQQSAKSHEKLHLKYK